MDSTADELEYETLYEEDEKDEDNATVEVIQLSDHLPTSHVNHTESFDETITNDEYYEELETLEDEVDSPKPMVPLKKVFPHKIIMNSTTRILPKGITLKEGPIASTSFSKGSQQQQKMTIPSKPMLAKIAPKPSHKMLLGQLKITGSPSPVKIVRTSDGNVMPLKNLMGINKKPIQITQIGGQANIASPSGSTTFGGAKKVIVMPKSMQIKSPNQVAATTTTQQQRPGQMHPPLKSITTINGERRIIISSAGASTSGSTPQQKIGQTSMVKIINNNTTDKSSPGGSAAPLPSQYKMMNINNVMQRVRVINANAAQGSEKKFVPLSESTVGKVMVKRVVPMNKSQIKVTGASPTTSTTTISNAAEQKTLRLVGSVGGVGGLGQSKNIKIVPREANSKPVSKIDTQKMQRITPEQFRQLKTAQTTKIQYVVVGDNIVQKLQSTNAGKLLNKQGSVPTSGNTGIAGPSASGKMLQYNSVLKKVTPEEKAKFEQRMEMDKIEKKEKLEKSQEVSEASVEEEEVEIGGTRRKHCNCTKSQCLKLYCDCFANGEFCKDCNCKECFNNLDNEKERAVAINLCLERNPEAFHRPKLSKNSDEMDVNRRHNKGCNCKRSGCCKNYCECFEAKIPCSVHCKCVGCRNVEDHLGNFQGDVALTDHDITGNRRKRHGPDDGPLAKKPFNYMTPDVIDATIQCLISTAEECTRADHPAHISEKMIIEEFGRCLVEIIEFARESGGE